MFKNVHKIPESRQGEKIKDDYFEPDPHLIADLYYRHFRIIM